MVVYRKANVKVLYLCDFDLSRGTGKDRATNQKLQALKGQVKELKIVSHSGGGAFFRLLSSVFLDLKTVLLILWWRPDWLISRGYVGFFSQALCNYLGVVTVREIHANALEELSLLPYKGVKLKVISLLARHAHQVDLSAKVRIFNHPDLLAWYQANGLSGEHDFFVYNGFSPSAASNLSRSAARRKFGLSNDDKLIVFVGAASKWHGVEYMVELQRNLSKSGESIRVVFGGGNVSSFDPEGLCLNFTPLDDKGCADLIRAADFCALPVKQNRVSPGSPLKLYDYIVNERFVLAQASTNGYSDEVERFGIGITVDFSSTETAHVAVREAFKASLPFPYPACNASWSDRMAEWVAGIELAVSRSQSLEG